MPEVICDTSPLQCRHQIGQLDLPIPEDLPWADFDAPSRVKGEKVVLLVADLGPGETGVLLMARERADPVVILDDALVRQASPPGSRCLHRRKLLPFRFTDILVQGARWLTKSPT